LFSLPLVMTAPLFYPLAAVPLYVRVPAAFNPFTYGVLLVRSPATGSFPVGAVAGLVLTVAAVAAALALAARRHELISNEQG
jgi:ABC-2 type transport system permease protein